MHCHKVMSAIALTYKKLRWHIKNLSSYHTFVVYLLCFMVAMFLILLEVNLPSYCQTSMVSFPLYYPELRDKEEKFALVAEGVNTCHLSSVNAEYVAKLIRKHGTDCQVGSL